jgi:hypothetical protein
MSKIDRKDLQKLILKEMKMLGMADLNPMADMVSSGVCPSCGQRDCACDSVESDLSHMSQSSMGNVSREDCCSAVKALIGCCSCPVTKQALTECCNDIMAGKHDM